jgi:hypothetical protein
MPFVRILLVTVALLGLVIAGLAFFRPDPNAVPVPQADIAPPAPRPIPAAPSRQGPPIMSPADASSPAEITAREAEEAQRRLEQEAGESKMMVPDVAPAEMMPPDVAPPVK